MQLLASIIRLELEFQKFYGDTAHHLDIRQRVHLIMSTLFDRLDAPSAYRDRSGRSNTQDLSKSTTLYIGNLSFYTTEEQIHELFSKCGEIKRIIMGLDRNTKSPCGFCFVEFYNHQDATDCMLYISGTKLDDRVVRCDLDPGYTDGRQWGRGKSGGQVRDEYRDDFDNGRGGWGTRAAKQPPV